MEIKLDYENKYGRKVQAFGSVPDAILERVCQTIDKQFVGLASGKNIPLAKLVGYYTIDPTRVTIAQLAWLFKYREVLLFENKANVLKIWVVEKQSLEKIEIK